MSEMYRSTAIKVSANPDPRLFGAGCLSTASVEDIAELCQIMLDNAQAMADYRFNLRLYPRNHVVLVIGGAVNGEPGREEFGWFTRVFIEALDQYNWLNPEDPADRRFTVCGIQLLDADLTQGMADVGRVTAVTGTPCDCLAYILSHLS